MIKPIYKKFISSLIWLAVLGAGVYFFRDQIFNVGRQTYQTYFPCRSPILYSIGTFDKQFGISEKNFLASVTQAEQIWEKPIGVNLFEYAPSGSLKINLVYDYRQDATVKLRTLGITVNEDKAGYDKLKAQYITLQKSYLNDKALLNNRIKEINSRTVALNAEVDSWNARGGAPEGVAARLRAEEASLNQYIDNFKIAQNNFNQKVEELNAMADTLNRLARALNLTVDRYNTIGQSRGREFEEGTFISSAEGQEIFIYQYDNTGKLVRVLAHELGHALGLDHNTSTKAIMYYLNNGINEKLMPADLAQLKQHCGI